MKAGMITILLNHVYYSPLGHVLEAVQYAKRFHDANPGSSVHVALSDGAPWELCAGAPWIAGVYRVPVGDPGTCDLSIPEMRREWDYVVDNNLMRLEVEDNALLVGQGLRPEDHEPQVGWEEEATLAYYARTDAELVARRGRGSLFPQLRLPEGLHYDATARMALEVPAEARSFARRYAHPGPKIAILPAGSGPTAQYPRPESWTEIIAALRERFADARFYLTGTKDPGRHPHLTTTCYSASDFSQILASGDDIIDCCDIGLWNQAALLETCDLLVSPHSGFSFLALCVGTPWLTISGGNWAESFSNGVPFYSVLPDNPDYPYLGAYGSDYDGATIPDMQAERLRARIPDLLEGARFLLDPATTYEEALRQHQANIARARIRRERMPNMALLPRPSARALP